MQGVEIGHCNAAINAVLAANYTLQDATVEELLPPTGSYGKKDTLGLDARPEIDIVQYMRKHDDNCVVITEEIGAKKKFSLPHNHDPRTFRTTYISDPLDRTKFMKAFLEQVTDKTLKVKDIIQHESAIADWERIAGSPATITGA